MPAGGAIATATGSAIATGGAIRLSWSFGPSSLLLIVLLGVLTLQIASQSIACFFSGTQTGTTTKEIYAILSARTAYGNVVDQ